jgi:hypothetical protein
VSRKSLNPRPFTTRSPRSFPGGYWPARNIPKWRPSNFSQRSAPTLPNQNVSCEPSVDADAKPADEKLGFGLALRNCAGESSSKNSNIRGQNDDHETIRISGLHNDSSAGEIMELGMVRFLPSVKPGRFKRVFQAGARLGDRLAIEFNRNRPKENETPIAELWRLTETPEAEPPRTKPAGPPRTPRQ